MKNESSKPRCDICPLNGGTPIPLQEGPGIMELLAGNGIAIIGNFPSESEAKSGTLLAGPAGRELNVALRQARVDRRKALVTNVLGCPVPGGRLSEFQKKLNRHNRKNPEDQIANPIECCRPRFEAEIDGHTKFIALGKTALHAISGTSASIMALRGSLMELDATERSPDRMIMPTLSPSFVLHSPKWAHVFRNDVFKAGKHFRGAAKWVPPEVMYDPSPEQLTDFLSDTSKIYTYDLETDGIESLTAKIRCVGVTNGTGRGIVVSVLGKDGFRTFYSPKDEKRIIAVFKDFFEDPHRMKCGHNSISYDTTILRSQWGVVVSAQLDTMLLHRSVESELPHSLAFVGSMYTDAPSWKTDRQGKKLAYGAESDEELAEYCGMDCRVTELVLGQLVEKVKMRNQTQVWQLDQKMQEVCADMHTVGMFVDQKKRHEEEIRLLARRFELLNEIRERLGNSDFNPGSVYHVRDILFTQWQLEPPVDDKIRLTMMGDPSTSDEILRSLLSSKAVPKEKRALIKLIRYYRKVQKVIGTYVTKLRFSDITIEENLGWDDDEDWVEADTRRRYGIERRGITDPVTGRMHPGYNAGATVTGRFSSSRPINAQNFPSALRGMVVAQPGHVLVGADMDQLELRVAAARWSIQLYLTAFKEGKDPHSMTANAVFGNEFCKAAGVSSDQFQRPGKLVGACYTDGVFNGSNPEAKKMRSLSKAVQFASQYKGSVETVQSIIRKTEIPSKAKDGTTDLPYALMPLRRVREMRSNWLRDAPEFEAGWEKELSHYRNHGYTKDSVLGRRRDFLDGENPNEIVNFAIQCGAASLMNIAMAQLHEEIPRFKWGPGTGIINQCHDSIVVECPENKAEEVSALLEACMNQTHPDLPGVHFTATAEIGHSWKEVG